MLKRCGKLVDRINWGGMRQLVERVAAQRGRAEEAASVARARFPTRGDAVSESST